MTKWLREREIFDFWQSDQECVIVTFRECVIMSDWLRDSEKDEVFVVLWEIVLRKRFTYKEQNVLS